MLTREQRDKWAEELESGRWKQCRGALRRNERRCCLGVLADAVLTDRAIPDVPEHKDLPLSPTDSARFVELNDVEKRTFRTIAKHVRALPVSDGEP